MDNINNLLYDVFSNRNSISVKNLVKLGLSRYEINELICYNILQYDHNGIYRLNDNIDDLSYYDVNCEAETYKKTYIYYLQKKDYINAYNYLEKYIIHCTKNNIPGHYYYYLENLHEKENCCKLGDSKAIQLESIHKEFDKLIASKEYEKALEKAKEYSYISENNNLFSYLLQGIAYNRLKNNDYARFYINQALSIFLNSPTSYSELAKIDMSEYNYNDSIINLNNVLKFDSINLNAYILLYKSYFLNGNYDKLEYVQSIVGQKLKRKKVKHFNSEIDSFMKALYYRNCNRIENIEKISTSDYSLEERIYLINDYVLNLDDCDINKSLILYASLDVINPDTREIYRLSIDEDDRDFLKPYVKEYKKRREEYNNG